MIERGSGRTSGLTDWRLMDVLSMWACLQDQDTTGQWKQVAGWRKVCDLALAHLSRLREYRRGLAEAWPPETNAAARAYLGELDQLIDQVQRTHDAAAANYDALAAATRAIGSTRAELQPLHDEYADKVRQKRAYETILADPKAVAGSRLPEKPPVTDAELEQLNVRARGLMTGLSGELQQAQVMLRQPPPKPKLPKQTEDADTYGNAAPVIPPIVPVPAAGSDAPRRQSASVTRPATPPPALSVGPVLGGAGTGLTTSPPSAPNGLPAPTSASNSTSGASFTPPLNTGPIGRGSTALPGRGTSATSTPPTSRSGLPPSPPPRSMPPGGLIGGGPGMGLSQPNSSPRRVNPVGGIIGGGGAGTAPTGGAGSRPGAGRGMPPNGLHSVTPLGGSPGSTALGPGPASGPPFRRAIEDGRERHRRWDPDNPWEVDEGVDPVVKPPEERGPVDPGPAIGFDR
ncbi:hypothetical protein Nm8I071_59790 [Nonomuraea sp. TT08I-71]|nr:hypothetical protein Nm8I071_59790 [Nonomuraea sp. TT08I-71]